MGQLPLPFFTAVQKQRFWMPINVEHFLNIWHTHCLHIHAVLFVSFLLNVMHQQN